MVQKQRVSTRGPCVWKAQQVPGSITSDGSEASHEMAMQDSPEGIQFRERLALRERARKAFCAVDNQQSLRRALNQRTRPQRTVFHPGDWIMAWRKDSQWFGPLKVIIQEDENVIWAALGNKLFRLAPEHARPLSAVEEVQNRDQPAAPDIKSMLEQIRSGNTRFVDLPTIPIPTEENGNNPERSETSHEQPDGEPGIPEGRSTSMTPSENEYTPTVPEEEVRPESPSHPGPVMPEAPEDIPVPVEEEDDLLCDALTVNQDQAWRFKLDIDKRDIDHLRNDPNAQEMAFIVSASKRQKVEVKMSTLTHAEKKLFQEAKEKEIQSWLDTQTVCKILRNKIPQQNILRCMLTRTHISMPKIRDPRAGKPRLGWSSSDTKTLS